MYISVDVGGTNIRVAGSVNLEQLDFEGTIIRGLSSGDYQTDIQFIIESARTIAGPIPIEALGICIPGTLNDAKTVLLFANNLPAWENHPFAETLAEKLGCKVYADHDGVAAGIGEAYYGDVPSEFGYLIWGTGIGGASVRREGEMITAAREITWRTYFRPWEAACGGAALAKKYGKATTDFSSQDWEEVYSDFSRYWNEFIQEIRIKNVVFAGGLAIKHADYLMSLNNKLDTTIQISKLGSNSGLYGGFGLIRKHLNGQ